MIVVTGANGQLGRLVAEGLLKRIPASQLAVSVREPARASDLEARGVRVRHGDFAKPETLPHAFEGADQVLLISVNKLGQEAVQQHGIAINAAKQAGARRILYTSHQAASPSSRFAPAAGTHAPSEELLRSSGLAFVALRNGFYAESALFQLTQVAHTGRIAVPADGPVSWTARADLAEAAIVAITDPGRFDGVTSPLTGSQALLFEDIAGLASELLGRHVAREVISDDRYCQLKAEQGIPASMSKLLLSLFTAAREGEFNVVDPTLEHLLGHSPTPFRDVLAGSLQMPKLAS